MTPLSSEHVFVQTSQPGLSDLIHRSALLSLLDKCENIVLTKKDTHAFNSGADNSPDVVFTIKRVTSPLEPVSLPELRARLAQLKHPFDTNFEDLLVEMTGWHEHACNAVLRELVGPESKILDGLNAMCPVNPEDNLYANIDCTKNKFWRTKAVFAGDDTPIVDALTELWLQLALVPAPFRPDLILAGENVYNKYRSALKPNQRFGNNTMAKMGFDSLLFMTAPMVLDDNVHPDRAYYLNSYSLRFYTRETPFTLEFSDDGQAQCVFHGNLICHSRSQQGVLQIGSAA